MPHGLRLSFPLLLAALLTPAGALAQSNVVTPAPAPREGTVGPEQLRDFTLPGTRREQPEPANEAAPAPAPAAPAAQPDEQRPAATPPRSTVTTPVTDSRPPREVERKTAAEPAVTLGLTPATPSPAAREGFTPTFTQPPATEPFSPGEPVAAPAAQSTPLSWWPWLLAALAVAGAAFLVLRRPRETDEGAELAFAGGAVPAPVQPRPVAQPVPQPRAAAPAPASAPATPLAPQSKPAGIVSSRLRPWIEIDMIPERAVVTDQEAIIHFEVIVHNSGSVPARNVVVEAVALNAGSDQEGEIAAFFERSDADGGGIEIVPPLGQVALRNMVRMPRAAIREYAAEGRTLLVPIVAFNAGYRWSGGSGRSSAAFLVGRGEDGAEKMSPLRLDLGAREFRPMTRRRLELGVRR